MEPDLNKDHDLWKTAQERAGFKVHFIVYLIIISFLWILWTFIGYVNDGEYDHKWPIYPMFGWGLGVLLHYFIVYSWKKKLTLKEYEKLLKKENKIKNIQL
ncbi:MAG: 2TM domain-containing protein [Bacteroidales bacterium]